MAKTIIDLITSFPDDKLTLEHLGEELCEVGQMKSKIIRFGFEDEWPAGSGWTNRRKLIQELGHILAVIDILKAKGIVSQEEMDQYKTEKWQSMVKWNAYRGDKDDLKGE